MKGRSREKMDGRDNRGPGYVHIYCGGGKGKTTAAIGLAVRAAGRGRNVLVARFLKTDDSGEVAALRHIPGITVLPCERTFGFVSQMTPETRKEASKYYKRQFEKACRMVRDTDYGMLVLDEIMAACRYQMVPEEEVIGFLHCRPEYLEVVMTGRDPSSRLLSEADYISEVHMERHPYTRGIAAREGIEY